MAGALSSPPWQVQLTSFHGTLRASADPEAATRSREVGFQGK